MQHHSKKMYWSKFHKLCKDPLYLNTRKNWKYMYSVICFLSPFFILLFYGWQLHLTVPMCESQPSLLLEKKDMDDMTSPKAVHLYGIISVPLVFFIFWKNACIKTIQVHTYGELLRTIFRIKNFMTDEKFQWIT